MIECFEMNSTLSGVRNSAKVVLRPGALLMVGSMFRPMPKVILRSAWKFMD